MSVESLFRLFRFVLFSVPLLSVILLVGGLALFRFLANRRKASSTDWPVLCNLDPTVRFRCLVFLDDHHGLVFAAGWEDTWVYETSDGGRQWQIKQPLGRGPVE